MSLALFSRASQWTVLRRATLVLASSWLALACGSPVSRGTSEDAGVATACEQYLSVYGDCMRRLTPGKPEIAEARVVAARKALENVPDPAKRRETCVGASAQLRTSCR